MHFKIENGKTLDLSKDFFLLGDNLPIKKFDYIISLYSMDYHYNFDIYSEYLKNVSYEKTKIIFDTIRPEYFKKIFEVVNLIKTRKQNIHKSTRVACSKFLY